MDKLKVVMAELISENQLNEKYLDHPLKGNFKGFRDCHVEPDWLLIYQIKKPEIYFYRTGSHSEIFRI